MIHAFFEDGYWFEPKRYGIGAGLPIAWQGWALIAGYVAGLAGIGFLSKSDSGLGRIAAFLLFLLWTCALTQIARRRTRGGWRWRWGERD